MRTDETRIKAAGVLRCCLETVAVEHVGNEVEEGEKSSCDHCGESFVLSEGVWTPEWQLDPHQP